MASSVTAPLLDDAGRWEDAACAGLPGDMWFPSKGESANDGKAICAYCMIRMACLQYAVDNEIIDGTWGGLSQQERHHLNRQPAQLCCVPGCERSRSRMAGASRMCHAHGKAQLGGAA